MFAAGRDDRGPGRRALGRGHGLGAAARRVGRAAAAREGAARGGGRQEPVGRHQRATGDAAAVHAVVGPVADVVVVVRGRHDERRRQRRGQQRPGRPVLPAAVRARVPRTGVRQEAVAAAAQRRHGAAVGHEEAAGEEGELLVGDVRAGFVRLATETRASKAGWGGGRTIGISGTGNILLIVPCKLYTGSTPNNNPLKFVSIWMGIDVTILMMWGGAG